MEVKKMSQDGFRFSHDKRFWAVSFEEFLATASALCQIVSSRRNTLNIEVVTAEDYTTYNYTTTTFLLDEDEIERKRYMLDELTQEVWDRSFNVQVTLRDEQDSKPFMICVSCDKYADRKRMKFYGQCLDEDTCHVVISKFRHATLSRGIGDGMGKISNFNLMMGLMMGQKLTGIRLPV
ncbi:MAG: hypothetical protein UV22_C0012G0028 [Parcubacteria group bacterium GW2011_GWA2_42_35]|nr:MAG: hypothetical protein UV22_C0012G0028 [Parcubacteria group bacterium GW2011_GWA2_42_35]